MLALFVPLVLQAQQPPQPCNIVITGDFESQCVLPLGKYTYYTEYGDVLVACKGMQVTYTAAVNTGGITVTNWKWNVVGAATWNGDGMWPFSSTPTGLIFQVSRLAPTSSVSGLAPLMTQMK